MYAQGKAKAGVLGQGYFVCLHLYPPRNESLVLSQAGVTPELTQPQTFADMPQTLVCTVYGSVCLSLPQQERPGDPHGASGHTPSTVSKQKEMAAGV